MSGAAAGGIEVPVTRLDRGPDGRFLKGKSANPGGKKKPKTTPETILVDPGTSSALALIERVLKEKQDADVVESLRKRKRLLECCLKSRKKREAVLKKCKSDIVWYVNHFVWQFNPKKRTKRIGPFLTWDFQEEALVGHKGIVWCYENERTCVVEKSREMGASWLFLIFQDWLCLFFDNSQMLDISRSMEAVDDANPDSLFWKIRFMHKYLPDWLKGEIIEQNLIFHYKKTESYITGEASTKRAGVGGRAAVIFVDEFSKIRDDREIREYTANTSDCRFFNGTHQGVGTEFFKLTQEDTVVKLQMHWSRHPQKNQGLYSYDANRLRFWEYVPREGIKELRGPKYDYGPDYEFVMDGSPSGGPFPGLRSPWYDKKCKDIGTVRAIAMELDIDPKGSASSPFDAMLIHELKQLCRPPSWEGELEHTTDGEPIRLVEVPGGLVKLWCPVVNGRPPRGVYAAGADVAAGTGTSPSCLAIANARTGAKVLEWSSAQVRPDRFATFAAAICRLFSDQEGTGAKLVWEHTGGPGVNFGQTLMDEMGYRHVFKNENQFLKTTKRTVSQVGFRPAGSMKNVLLTDYILALTNREYYNPSLEALEECLSFRYSPTGLMVHSREQGKDPESSRENHGDMVIMDALCWKMVKDLGVLASRQKPEEPPLPAEDNIFTVAGRRALHERSRREEWD